jgi:hypothetical protein
MPEHWLTKAGRYGTLYRYRATYTDPLDPGNPVGTWGCWAYNPDHAREQFAGVGDEGFQILKLQRVKAS